MAEILDDFFPCIDGVIKHRETYLERYVTGPWVFIIDMLPKVARERKEEPKVLYECVDISVLIQTLVGQRLRNSDVDLRPLSMSIL